MPTLLHGTLRLARAEGTAAGVRFMDHLESDGPETVVDPQGLPAAEITLRAFRDPAARAGYVAALSEHGGNAVAWVESPERAGPPMLLVVRFDRPPREGATLDEAIPLVGGPEGLSAAYAQRRDRAISEEARQAERNEIEAIWATETAALRKLNAILTATGREGIEFFLQDISDRMGSVRLWREGDALRLGWNPIRAAFAGDLAREWKAGMERLGIVDYGPKGFGMPVERLDEASFSALREARLGLNGLFGALSDKANRRKRIEALAANPAGVRTVERAAAGLLVMSCEKLAPCGQMSPRSRRAQVVSRSLVSSLVQDGMLRPLWGKWDDGFNAVGRRAPVIYGVTEFGRAFVEGRKEEAAAGVRLRPGDPEVLPFDDLDEALGSLAETLRDTAPPLEAEPFDGRVPLASDYDTWGRIFAEALAGRLRLSPDGRSVDEEALGVKPA